MKIKDFYIIGGGSGLIGSHLVSKFSELGHGVVSLDMKPSKNKSPNIKDFQGDLSDETVVSDFFSSFFSDQTFNHCVLINTQGIADPVSGPLANLQLVDWQKYLDTNLTSYFLCCREFVRHKDHFQTGSIVNISSTRHLMAEQNTEAYCASKGGITSLTQALAISLSNTGIRVNSISPGWIADPNDNFSKEDHHQHPSGRVGHPHDIFLACRYLTDPNQVFVTGQDLVVDGGMTKKMIYK